MIVLHYQSSGQSSTKLVLALPIFQPYVTFIRDVSAVKVGNMVSQHFAVTKGLTQRCSIALTLFKIHINTAYVGRKDTVMKMGILINDDISNAFDQVVTTGRTACLLYTSRCV